MEKPDLSAIPVIDNPDFSRFEMTVKGYLAIIEYQKREGKIYLTHTEVPEELAGQGVGSHLIRSSLQMIEKENLKVVPVCSFVSAFIRKNAEFQKLLLPGIRIN